LAEHIVEAEGYEADKLDGVPFLLEDVLRQQGAEFSAGDDWAAYTVQDGLLITGQNPASSVGAAEHVLKAL